MDMLDGETEVRDYSLERLMMLSDGVFAIAMTLMALELRPPEHWNGGVGSLLRGMANPLFAFVLSFASIGAQWASHRQSFGRFRRADFWLTAYSLVFLGLIVVVPAATWALAQSRFSTGMVWLYIGLFAALGLVNGLLWCHAAFFTDILKPGSSLRLRVTVALILLLFAPLMTALGVLMSQPGLRWLGFLIPVVGIAGGAIRRWAGKGEVPSVAAA
jgi:uncharacterized membrane protein